MNKALLREHIKPTLELALPITVGQVGHVMMGVIDNAMVGRISAYHLAASSIANGLYFIILVVGIGITYAIAPLVSAAEGSGDKNECSEILHNALYINLCAAIVLFLITWFLAPLISFFGQEQKVTELAVPYVRIIGFSAFPVMIFQTYRQFSEGLSIMKPAMIITVLANIVHAGFNYILIYGKFGAPALELNGAGWATILSRTVMAAAMMLYVLKNKKFNAFNRDIFPYRFSKRLSAKILLLGAGSGFQYFFEVACFAFAAVMVGWIGARQLAAHQIALSLASLTYMVVVGVSAASAIRVGNYGGAGDRLNLRYAGFTAILTAVAFMIFSGMMMILLRNFLPSLYIKDADVLNIASSLLVVAALFQVFDGTQAVGLGILRGMSDSKMPTLITFTAYWIIAIPLAYLFGFTMNFGVTGIWYGLLTGLAASAAMLTMRFNTLSRNKIPQGVS